MRTAAAGRLRRSLPVGRPWSPPEAVRPLSLTTTPPPAARVKPGRRRSPPPASCRTRCPRRWEPTRRCRLPPFPRLRATHPTNGQPRAASQRRSTVRAKRGAPRCASSSRRVERKRKSDVEPREEGLLGPPSKRSVARGRRRAKERPNQRGAPPRLNEVERLKLLSIHKK